MARQARPLLTRLFARSATDEPKGQSKPRGRAGTVNTRGFIGDDREFNAKLIWPYNLTTYDEMIRADATIRWLLLLIETPVRSLVWDIEPAGTEDEDLEIAAFCRHAIFEELDGGFDEFLRQALHFLRYGHYVFERVAEMREVSFDVETEEIKVAVPPPPPMVPPPREEEEQASKPPANGGPPRPPPPMGPPPPPAPVGRRVVETKTVEREAFVISRLEPRLPRTIQRWIPVTGDTSKLKAIEQFLGDGEEPATVEIPAERLLVFTLEKEGNDWRGLSLLRQAYKPYRYKAGLENIESIAYERSAGLPLVYPPDDATDDQLRDVEAAIGALRQGENLWIRMPGPKAGTTQDGQGWLLEDFVLRADGDSTSSIGGAIARYDAEVARIALAEFMRLGHENVGARATGEVQQDPYYQAVEALTGYVEDVITEGIVRPLVAWNYETERFPKMKASKAAAQNVAQTIEALSKASSMGLKLDPALEAWIRELLDAPERPPELDEAEAELAENPPSQNGGPPPPAKPGEKVKGKEKPAEAEGAAPGETMTAGWTDLDEDGLTVERLTETFGRNWVEQQGGLPERIKHLAGKLQKKGMTESRAIATAVSQAKKFCAQGDEPEWCAAVAQWEKMKAATHAMSASPADELATALVSEVDRNVAEALESLDALRRDNVPVATSEEFDFRESAHPRDKAGRFRAKLDAVIKAQEIALEKTEAEDAAFRDYMLNPEKSAQSRGATAGNTRRAADEAAGDADRAWVNLSEEEAGPEIEEMIGRSAVPYEEKIAALKKRRAEVVGEDRAERDQIESAVRRQIPRDERQLGRSEGGRGEPKVGDKIPIERHGKTYEAEITEVTKTRAQFEYTTEKGQKKRAWAQKGSPDLDPTEARPSRMNREGGGSKMDEIEANIEAESKKLRERREAAADSGPAPTPKQVKDNDREIARLERKLAEGGRNVGATRAALERRRKKADQWRARGNP